MIYICIPVHDERDTIGPLLWRIREVLGSARTQFCVWVCDDASGDDSRQGLLRYGQVLPLTVLKNRERKGYARTVNRLVGAVLNDSRYHKRDGLVIMQGDLSDPPELLPEMIRRFHGGADLVTIDRPPEEPLRRRLVRTGGRWALRRVGLPSEVSDPYGSIRLTRLFALRRAIAGMDDASCYEGWAANAASLVRVWPFVRQAVELDHEPRSPRRYRGTRFRPLSQWRSLWAAGRDPDLLEIGHQLRQA